MFVSKARPSLVVKTRRASIAGCEEHTIVICNAILNSEVMTDAQTDAMVDRLANHVKKELAD